MADTHKTINCPACGTQMKKIFIADLGINIDICVDGCGGIYLDNREFQKFDEQHEHIDEYIQQIENADYSHVTVEEEAVRICPACGAKMVKNPTSVKGEVIIDECYTCGGKFLDHGELTKIRAEYATEKDRSQAAIQAFLYSPEAAEMNYLSSTSARVNRKLDRRNHSILGRIFNAIFDRI